MKTAVKLTVTETKNQPILVLNQVFENIAQFLHEMVVLNILNRHKCHSCRPIASTIGVEVEEVEKRTQLPLAAANIPTHPRMAHITKVVIHKIPVHRMANGMGDAQPTSVSRKHAHIHSASRNPKYFAY